MRIPFVCVERIHQRAVQLLDRQPVVGTCEYGLQSDTRASNRLRDSRRVISLSGLVIWARHCPNDRAGFICRSNLGLRDNFNSPRATFAGHKVNVLLDHGPLELRCCGR